MVGDKLDPKKLGAVNLYISKVIEATFMILRSQMSVKQGWGCLYFTGLQELSELSSLCEVPMRTEQDR